MITCEKIGLICDAQVGRESAHLKRGEKMVFWGEIWPPPPNSLFLFTFFLDLFPIEKTEAKQNSS